MANLTVAEKAKVYDEVFERAKREYEAHKPFNGFRGMLARIFPELCESEDVYSKECDQLYQDGVNDVLENPQKYGLQKQCKRVTTWSEDDEKMLDDACIMLDWYKGNNWWKAQYIKNWLKSLKDRMQLQSKHEWSGEDEEMIECLANCLDELEKDNGYVYDYINELNKVRKWLKSRRPRKQWKPSDEQITWLYRAADDARKDSRMKQILNELLFDLKKLKGE